MSTSISPEIYLKVIDHWRERGWAKTTYGEIARLVGIDRRQVSYLWLNGLKETKTHPALPPIKRVAEDEIRSGVRFRLSAAGAPASPVPPTATPDAVIALAPVAAPAPPVRITRADIEEHAQEALVSELRAIAAVRDAAVGAAVSARKMLGALQGRLDKMAVEIGEEDARGVKVDQVATSKLIHRILIVAEKASQVTKQVIESERLALGSPTEIIKVMEAPTAAAPNEAAEAEARATRVLALLSARRKDRPALPAVENRFVEEVDEESEASDPVEAAPAETELDAADGELDVVDTDVDDKENDV